MSTQLKLINILIFLCVVFFFACVNDKFDNPYDPDTDLKIKPPTFLRVNQINENSIKLEWNHEGPIIGFKIRRRKGHSGEFKLIKEITKSARSYIDPNVILGSTYYYQVVSFISNKEESAEISIDHFFIGPDSLLAEIISKDKIQLTWEDNSVIENGFKIERKKENETIFTQIGTVGANVINFIDNVDEQGIKYYYKVNAFSSSVQTAATETDIFFFPPPSNLQIISISEHEIELTWQDNSNFEIGFNISRIEFKGTSYTETSFGVEENTTSFIDTGLNTRYEYSYKVKAISTNNSSKYSEELTITTTSEWNIIRDPSDYFYDIISLFFVDSINGWFFELYNIKRSYDGGVSWQIISSPTSDYIGQNVFFIDKNIGWIACERCNKTQNDMIGLMYLTFNGGHSWEEVIIRYTSLPNPYDTNILAIYFINNKLGWIAGDNGKIFKTNDGGYNWVHQHSFIDENINDIFFISENMGWAVSRYGTILFSENGGHTWSVQYRNTNFHLDGVYFIDGFNGWSWGGESGKAVLLVTNNAGKSWNNYELTATRIIRDIIFLDNMTGWMIGQNQDYEGVLLKSNDGGLNWNREEYGSDKSLYSITFPNTEIGWAGGGNGIIIKMSKAWSKKNY